MLNRILNAACIAAFACIVLGFGFLEWKMSPHAPPRYQKQTNTSHNSENKTNNILPTEDANDRIGYTLWLAILTWRPGRYGRHPRLFPAPRRSNRTDQRQRGKRCG